MSVLKPPESISVALGVAGGVYALYSNLPTTPDIRVSEPQDADLAAEERKAAILAACGVAGISLLTRDPTVFVVGGLAVIGMSWWHKLANAHDPITGRVLGAGAQPVGATYTEMVAEAADEAGAY